MIKSLSGGEKKRLSFGSELVTDPIILFCDEPTSGLDAFMAAQTVRVLRDLAEKGRIILCTIHQPSSEVFSIFDQVLLVGAGRTILLSSEKIYELFLAVGQPVPEQFNPADWVIEVLYSNPQEVVEVYEASQLYNQQIAEIEEEIKNADLQLNPNLDIMSRSKRKISAIMQFYYVLQRNLMAKLKNPTFYLINVPVGATVSILLGFVFFQQDKSVSGVANITGALYLIVLQQTFSLVTESAAFCEVLPFYKREQSKGLYLAPVYFFARLLTELCVKVVELMISYSIVYWMIGLNPAADRFIVGFLYVFYLHILIQTWSACLAVTSSHSTVLAPFLAILNLLCSDFFLGSDHVLSYVTWDTSAVELLTVNQWSNVTVAAVYRDIQISGDIILESKNLDPGDIPVNLGILTIFIVVSLVLSLAGLYFRQ